MKIYPGEPLNILHTIGLNEMYPIVRCQIDLTQPLDGVRLQKAVQLVGQVVPQIFGRYELQQNTFVVEEAKTAPIIQSLAANQQPDTVPLDFMQGPQLRLYLQTQQSGQRLTLIMSHILSDGAGFKQLLYLLVDCYNRGTVAIEGKQNDQSIAPVQALIDRRQSVTQKITDHPQQPLFLPQLAAHDAQIYRVARVHFSVSETEQLHAAARVSGVTLNDLFMAAFGQIIQQYSGVTDLTLACPTDMRQFFATAEQTTLRIANLTARYNLILPDTLELSLAQLIQLVHQQMQTLKEQQQFLDSVTDLLARAQTDSMAKLQQVAEANYHVRPIAYTNFGVIDAVKIQFTGTTINDFVLTGSFRRAPMFQVAVSTFDDQLMFAFNMIGNELEYRFGMMILRQMKQNLLLWGGNK